MTEENKLPILKPGDNPRKMFKNHKERGPKAHTYTIDDIVKLTGYCRNSLRTIFSRDKINIDSLEEIIDFVNKARARQVVHDTQKDDIEF